MSYISADAIRYDTYENAPAFARKEISFVLNLVREHGARVVLEAGSGANPVLSAEHAARLGIRYITTDASADELAKAPTAIERHVIDFAGDRLPDDLLGANDLVFSRWLGEHVSDARRYHTNVRRLLRPGGVAVHCFSCLFAAPFLLNRLVPPKLSALLLARFQPRDEHQHGKFRAYYDWCRGPTARAIRNFEAIGYDVLSYTGYFGHYYYKGRLPLLDRLEALKSQALLSHPIPQLCAFATVVLRRRE